MAATDAILAGDANALDAGELPSDADCTPGLLGAAFTNEGANAGPAADLEGSSGMWVELKPLVSFGEPPARYVEGVCGCLFPKAGFELDSAFAGLNPCKEENDAGTALGSSSWACAGKVLLLRGGAKAAGDPL